MTWLLFVSVTLQHVLCGSVAEFGVLATSLSTPFPAGDVWHGRNGISYCMILYHPRRGGSPSEESGTPDSKLQGKLTVEMKRKLRRRLEHVWDTPTMLA